MCVGLPWSIVRDSNSRQIKKVFRYGDQWNLPIDRIWKVKDRED